MENDKPILHLRRLGIDPYKEAVIYMREDCHICRSEGFEVQTRVRVTLTVVKGKDVMVVCGLDRPDQKAIALTFFADVAKEMGATRIGLIAAYLGYMRQDKRFHTGEAITSNIFARFLSSQVDWLVTIDPHLHRHKFLQDIYSIPSRVLHAADTIAAWIHDRIENPVLIGPDEESEQWVSEVADKAKAPFTILTKIRHGDREVDVSVPDVETYKEHTPVLVDDIISTAQTMIETVAHLHAAGMQPPVCIRGTCGVCRRCLCCIKGVRRRTDCHLQYDYPCF